MDCFNNRLTIILVGSNVTCFFNGTTLGDTQCPSGWGVPTDAEWTILITYLGGEDVAGGKMKSTGTTYWSLPNTGADNLSGFSALPGGARRIDAIFDYIRYYAFFWSATESGSTAWTRTLVTSDGSVGRYLNNKSVWCFRPLPQGLTIGLFDYFVGEVCVWTVCGYFVEYLPTKWFQKTMHASHRLLRDRISGNVFV